MSPSNSAAHPGVRVLVVDNHDSFVFTLVGYLEELGAEVTVVEADEVPDVDTVLTGFEAVMISPGPGSPRDAGASAAIVSTAARARIPVLGVCLGHQVIAEVFGARIVRSPQPMHGRSSTLTHDGSGVMQGQRERATVGRYHSLAIDEATLPDELTVIARSEDGVIMAVSHRELPITGVQFHPESVLTERGHRMLALWLDAVRDTGATRRSDTMNPHVATAHP